jgi:hypothetical protein
MRLPFFLLLKFNNARASKEPPKRVVGRGVMCRFEWCVVVTREGEENFLNFEIFLYDFFVHLSIRFVSLYLLVPKEYRSIST